MTCSGCTENGVPVCAGKIRYVPPVWDDARTPATGTNIGGANDPAFSKLLDNGAGSTGIFTYQFPSGQDRELFFWVQLTHRWMEGTILKPHIHWAPVDAGAGDVVWGMEYTKATPLTVLPNSTIITVTQSTDTTALKHQIAVLPDIAAAGDKISTMLGCRLYREGTAGADTYGNGAALLEVDFHIMLNTPGSVQEYIK
jgi:hypothetical protein